MGRKKTKITEEPGRGPLVLCLETATGVSSVALFEEDRLLGSLEYHADKLHARLVTVMIDHLLSDLSLQPSDLSAVAVAAGPGSYTGLRVGVSTAKGLCMALDLPLYSLGSLPALAQTVQPLARELGARICPMIDARRMEVFCAVYDAEMSEQLPVQALVVEDGSFSELLEAGPVLFIGDGAAKCRPLLNHAHAIVLDQQLSSATGLGRPVWQKIKAGQAEDLLSFEPFYLKDFVATQRKKKLL